MIAVFGEHAGVAGEFQAEVRKLPDLERLLTKAVKMLMRFQRRVPCTGCCAPANNILCLARHG